MQKPTDLVPKNQWKHSEKDPNSQKRSPACKSPKGKTQKDDYPHEFILIKSADAPVSNKLQNMIQSLEQFLYRPIEELKVTDSPHSSVKRTKRIMKKARREDPDSRKEQQMEVVFNAIISHFQ